MIFSNCWNCRRIACQEGCVASVKRGCCDVCNGLSKGDWLNIHAVFESIFANRSDSVRNCQIGYAQTACKGVCGDWRYASVRRNYAVVCTQHELFANICDEAIVLTVVHIRRSRVAKRLDNSQNEIAIGGRLFDNFAIGYHLHVVDYFIQIASVECASGDRIIQWRRFDSSYHFVILKSVFCDVFDDNALVNERKDNRWTVTDIASYRISVDNESFCAVECTVNGDIRQFVWTEARYIFVTAFNGRALDVPTDKEFVFKLCIRERDIVVLNGVSLRICMRSVFQNVIDIIDNRSILRLNRDVWRYRRSKIKHPFRKRIAGFFRSDFGKARKWVFFDLLVKHCSAAVTIERYSINRSATNSDSIKRNIIAVFNKYVEGVVSNNLQRARFASDLVWAFQIGKYAKFCAVRNLDFVYKWERRSGIGHA